jgi:hypothetical protein
MSSSEVNRPVTPSDGYSANKSPADNNIEVITLPSLVMPMTWLDMPGQVASRSCGVPAATRPKDLVAASPPYCNPARDS